MDDHRTRSEILQRNERTKALSNIGINIGTGLLAAGAVRLYFGTVDGHAIFWLIVGALLIWTGVAVLALLEAEV